jgi:hypothetical protein
MEWSRIPAVAVATKVGHLSSCIARLKTFFPVEERPCPRMESKASSFPETTLSCKARALAPQSLKPEDAFI